MEFYDITVAGMKRSLPIVPISDTASIASFVIFGDTEIVEPCARALAAMLPEVDYLITAEAKSIPLIYEMARVMKMPRYIIARKSVKGYMVNPIVTKVRSITTDHEQLLCLDESDIKLLAGARVAIVDDVISTGGSIAGIEALVNKAGGTVAARAAILAEGDSAKREDILYLGTIPIFVRNSDSESL